MREQLMEKGEARVWVYGAKGGWARTAEIMRVGSRCWVEEGALEGRAREGEEGPSADLRE